LTLAQDRHGKVQGLSALVTQCGGKFSVARSSRPCSRFTHQMFQELRTALRTCLILALTAE